MMYDTSVIVEMLRKGVYEPGLISFITLLEVLRGVKPEKRAKVKSLLEKSFEIHWLDNKALEVYCKLYDKLRHKGEPIPDADPLIASIAIARGETLKTRDKHFKRLVKYGLKLELV